MRNIISNQQGGLSVLGLTRKDSILGFLPAFHSFGMNVTGLLPLETGVACRPPPRPDRRWRPGPQDCGLQADHTRRYADLHELYPRPCQAWRPGLPANDHRGCGKMPPSRFSSASLSWRPRIFVGGLRHHGMLTGRFCQPSRREPRRHGGQAASRRGAARARPGHRQAVGAEPAGHAARQRADGVPRLRRLRRAFAVQGDRRQTLVRDRRPGESRRRTVTFSSAAG